MRTRYTVLPAVALAFAAGACTQGEADRDAADQAVEVVTAFQETTQEHLNMIAAQIDTARVHLDSLGGDVEAEAEARLSAVAARREALAQSLWTLVWQGEAQWDSTTQAIKRELNELRAEVAAVLAHGAASRDVSAVEPAKPRAGDMASGRRP
jgi:hypothetical protein